MDYMRFGRSLVAQGGLFDDAQSAIDFCKGIESDVLNEQIQNLSFSTDEEGLLTVLINNKSFHVSHTALKDLCKLLKVPAGYLNKFPGRDLVLENLNSNPYLVDNSDPIRLPVWEGEKHPVIAGVLPGNDPALAFSEYLELMKDEGAFDRETVKLDQIAVTGEELAVYFYLPQEMPHPGFTLQLGYALHYSALRAVDTVVQPFCKMSIVAATGEPFDFDMESAKKLHFAKRRKEDFIHRTLELAQRYGGEDLGAYYEEALKCATVSKNLDSVKYAVLKYFKSRAVSTYNCEGYKVDGNQVVDEVIPEYKEFFGAHKEQFKEMETYAANNLPVNFYLPVFLNRLFTFAPNIENPYFMIRYRRSAGNILNKVLDEVGDVIVEVPPAPAAATEE